MTTEQVDRQERRKRRTRQAIQTAALELFAERGYRETTISDIAERADVAPRTVTVHFPAKEELLFDAEPFTLDGLSKRLSGRGPHKSALEGVVAGAGAAAKLGLGVDDVRSQRAPLPEASVPLGPAGLDLRHRGRHPVAQCFERGFVRSSLGQAFAQAVERERFGVEEQDRKSVV